MRFNQTGYPEESPGALRLLSNSIEGGQELVITLSPEPEISCAKRPSSSISTRRNGVSMDLRCETFFQVWQLPLVSAKCNAREKKIHNKCLLKLSLN